MQRSLTLRSSSSTRSASCARATRTQVREGTTGRGSGTRTRQAGSRGRVAGRGAQRRSRPPRSSRPFAQRAATRILRWATAAPSRSSFLRRRTGGGEAARGRRVQIRGALRRGIQRRRLFGQRRDPALAVGERLCPRSARPRFSPRLLGRLELRGGEQDLQCDALRARRLPRGARQLRQGRARLVRRSAGGQISYLVVMPRPAPTVRPSLTRHVSLSVALCTSLPHRTLHPGTCQT